MNIYAYKNGSASAKALSEALGIKRLKHERSKFKGNANKTVINWGSSRLPEEVLRCKVINTPASVSKAANKFSFFRAMAEAGVSVPPHTEAPEAVAEWLEKGHTVVARTVLNGNSGEGIVLIEQGQEIVKAPLYTRYIPKKDEYRVHVAFGEVIDVQRKARKKDVEDADVNWRIRNLAGGFIFARADVGNAPVDVMEQAVHAVESIGLHFGAVDVIYNDKEKKAYVLEVNTAPGLMGTTLEIYTETFKKVMGNE